MVRAANLVVFMSDNHHRDYAGCYGHPQATTPTMDRIADRGVAFDRAYSASPLCCPARAALATGRFPHQTGYWDNAQAYDGRVTSWMRRLRDQGHEVTSIGKLHFRATEDDNGWSEELLPMHILDGRGGVHMLLRGHDAEPSHSLQWPLYWDRWGTGKAPYLQFDDRITATAREWIARHANPAPDAKPWVLFVSYPSTHPPFDVPEEFWQGIDEATIELPSNMGPGERSEHPSLQHLRKIKGMKDIDDPARVRKIIAAFLAHIRHLDNEMGKVVKALEEAGLADDTRLMYTSDHGELCGEHGLFGKSCMLEGSVGVPLIMCGPDVPAGRRVRQLASHVDLFPTIVESVGARLDPREDADLPGISLWRALEGEDDMARGCFAEYHAGGSKTGSFMWREGDHKLIWHVDMPPQLFDLAAPEGEGRDLVADGTGLDKARELEAKLRRICDPEEVDARCKADQRAKIEFWGGRAVVEAEGALVFTPPPGFAPEMDRHH